MGLIKLKNELIYYIRNFGLLNGIKYYLNLHFSKSKFISVRLRGLKNPIYLRRKSTDYEVFKQIFLNKEYDFELSHTPFNIIDCGANIGLASLFFHHKYPLAKIVAIEPQIDNFNQIGKNLEFLSRIHFLLGGVWNDNKTLNIENPRNQGEWAYVCKASDSGGENIVKGYTIDYIMDKFKMDSIDILKVDIEGSELELFSNNYDKWLSKTECIMIELHDGLRKGCSISFFKAISKYDFSVFIKGENLICIRNK